MGNEQKRVDRRELFKESAGFLGRLAGEIFAAASETKKMIASVGQEPESVTARGRMRPPGAVPEATFLSRCTRCDDCISACPEDVLFRAPTPFGAEVAGTPLFDPRRKSCFLCADLYCITACKENALVMPTGISQVAIGKARIVTHLCYAHLGGECQVCFDNCPLTGSAIQLFGDRPVIMPAECVGCGLCESACREKTGANAIITTARMA
jgi:MauM/NapG family ferredoxin protein